MSQHETSEPTPWRIESIRGHLAQSRLGLLPGLERTIRWLSAAVGVLAVMLVIGLMVARSREIASRDQCTNNLRQISLALLNYTSVADAFPTGTVVNASLSPEQRLSWWVFLGSYIEQGLGFVLDRDQAWDCGVNRVPMLRHWSTTGDPPPYSEPAGNFRLVQCPAHPHPANPAGACNTDYVGIAGVGLDAPSLPLNHPRAGMFGYDRQLRPADIKDGAANTLLIAETASANGPWTRGGPSTVRGVDPARTPYIGRGLQFGGLHPGGVNVVMADGSVRFLREDINPRVFEALATIAGGEPIPAGWGW